MCLRRLDKYRPTEVCELESVYRSIYLEVFESTKYALAEKIMSSELKKISDIESLLCKPLMPYGRA